MQRSIVYDSTRTSQIQCTAIAAVGIRIAIHNPAVNHHCALDCCLVENGQPIVVAEGAVAYLLYAVGNLYALEVAPDKGIIANILDGIGNSDTGQSSPVKRTIVYAPAAFEI